MKPKDPRGKKGFDDKTPRPFQCILMECPKRFVSEQNAYVHCRYTHKLNTGQLDKMFAPTKRSEYLKVNAPQISLAEAPIDDTIKTPNRVKTYNPEYNRARYLQAKQRIKRQGGRTKNFECPDCGRRYWNMILLRQHKFTHQATKTFQCPLAECNMTFRQPNSGLSHMRIHHKMKTNALSKAFETSVFKLDVWHAGQPKVPAAWLAKYQDEENCDLE
jgi:uncharacterized Zn-finger protein